MKKKKQIKKSKSEKINNNYERLNNKGKKDFKKYLSILGLIIPIIGFILYFIYRKNDKKLSLNILKFSIIGFCIYCIILLAFSQKNNYVQEPIVDNWYKDVKSGEQVVTIIGTTFCPHCQEYKPVITALAKKYKFKLYFFESDILSKEDLDKLVNTYDLVDFDDYVPFTFIIKNDKYVTGKAGFANKESSIDYLKEFGVIKN